MKKSIIYIFLFIITTNGFSQNQPIKDLKFNLNEDGTHWMQFTLMNQTWLRYNQSNRGTTVEGEANSQTFDIGLRRTRFQMFGQISDKVFLYFQVGQNNFNSQYNISTATNTTNRKNAMFIHDALCEYIVLPKNRLKLGGGLTIANGLSRFSQPGVSSIMTLDVPVFAQATVDQTDQFSRKLSLYARGQISKLDYRFVLSNPFPVTSNGAAAPALGKNATFATKGQHKQYQAYFIWQFKEHESMNTPYMSGTYLGNKNIFNIAAGAIFQPKALWHSPDSVPVYDNMMLWCVESFLDKPINKEKHTAINAYVGYFNTNYGNNYLRYNGSMNPANGLSLSNTVAIASNAYGNAYPMFGTGQQVYAQTGYLFPISQSIPSYGQLMPYVSSTVQQFQRLNNKTSVIYEAGINWFINGHKSKMTLNYQNRPTFILDSSGQPTSDQRRSCVVFQYQIMI